MNHIEMNIVNCFCIQGIHSGNPAAIVRNFVGSKNEKQALAKRLNLPVTVFLSEIIDGTCNIEYFYPEIEMSLCLHGTIGAAYVVSREKNLIDLTFITKYKKSLKTKILANTIQVHVSSQLIPSLSFDKLKIYKMLGLKNDNEIDLKLSFLISSVGSPKLLVPVKSLELLGSLKPNFDLITEWSVQNAINGLYVYTKDENGNNFEFHARGFNPKGGHQEDAATGVAAAALSLALKKSIVVRQGAFINCPSKIIVSYENADNIWVGGKVAETELLSE